MRYQKLSFRLIPAKIGPKNLPIKKSRKIKKDVPRVLFGATQGKARALFFENLPCKNPLF
jgi:hypothetical protein